MTSLDRVAVIGSNSFSGGDFVDLVLETGRYSVLGISRSPEKGPLFLAYHKRKAPLFRFMQADFNHDLAQMVTALDEFRPDYIVNFAAQSEVAPSWKHPEHWFETNVVALSRFINQLKDRDYLRRYVHISSPEVYGTCVGRVTEVAPVNPSTPYAVSKAAADMFLSTVARHFRFPLVTIRATNVYGARQQLFKIIPRSVINLRLGRTIELHGGGQAVKSYIHIRDVSRGELAAMERGTDQSIYHLSPPEGYAVRDVVRSICEKMGKDFDHCVTAVEERLGQDAAYIIDSTRAQTELAWRPQVSLSDGLNEVVSWVEEYWDEIRQTPLDYQHKP